MPFKEDIHQLADLNQQISQKMILLVQHIAKMSLCCEYHFCDICCFRSASWRMSSL